jgi:hypothetical protein
MRRGSLIKISESGMLSAGIDSQMPNLGVVVDSDDIFLRLAEIPGKEKCWKVLINKKIETFYEQDLTIL